MYSSDCITPYYWFQNVQYRHDNAKITVGQTPFQKMTVKPFSEDLLVGECTFLVWISKAVISLKLKRRPCHWQYLTIVFVIFLVAVADSNQLYVNIWFSYIRYLIIILSRVYNEPIQRPAPSWLVSSIGKSAARVSQRSRVRISYEPEFFQAFFSQLQKLHL